MDPGSGSGFRQIKGCLAILEPVSAIGAPEPKSHPVPAGCCALRDIVPAVDELSTREAHEFELALTTLMAFHSPLSRCRSLDSFFTSGGGCAVHNFAELFVLLTIFRFFFQYF